jgi:chromosome segregation ATPase
MSAVLFSGSQGPDATASARIDAGDAQRELERLLLQGRAHLVELRSRQQQTAAERDRLQAQRADIEKAHQQEVEDLKRQIDDLRAEQIAFTRLLDEASAIQRELTEQVKEQRQQIHTLRESAMRAQAFAREIMRAHETTQPFSKTEK